MRKEAGRTECEEHLGSGQRRPLIEAEHTAEPHAPTQDVCPLCGFP